MASGNLIWIVGNKQRGVSVKKLNYKRPLWRVGIWKKGSLFEVHDFLSRSEATEYARDRKRLKWYD